MVSRTFSFLVPGDVRRDWSIDCLFCPRKLECRMRDQCLIDEEIMEASSKSDLCIYERTQEDIIIVDGERIYRNRLKTEPDGEVRFTYRFKPRRWFDDILNKYNAKPKED